MSSDNVPMATSTGSTTGRFGAGSEALTTVNSISVSDALFVIQNEFKRFERERLAWSIERSELKAKLISLEQECATNNNLKLDLLKRIKMLEFALRKERKLQGPPEESGMDQVADEKQVIEESSKATVSHSENPAVVKARKALQSFLLKFESLDQDFKEDPKLENDLLNLKSSIRPKVVVAKSLKSTAEESEPVVSSSKAPQKGLSSPELNMTDENASNGKNAPTSIASTFKNIDINPKRATSMISSFDAESPSDSDSSNSKKELDDLAKLSISDDSALDDQKSATIKDNRKIETRNWKPKFTLRSHFDVVRTISFHPSKNILISASEDSTVKLWSIDSLSNKKTNTDIEPIMTYRGHMKGVTSLSVSPINEELLFSSGMDSVIKSWKIVPYDRSPYSSYDPSFCISTFVGHSDIVWQVKAHYQQHILASISADSTIKLWNIGSANPLVASWSADPTEKKLIPTSMDFVPNNPNQILVSFNDSSLRLYDMEKTTAVTTFDSQGTYDSTCNTQINCITAHTTLPLILSGHEDRYIRFFSYNQGKCVHSMVAHLDAVQSLDVHSSGLTLVSAGHDASVRFWDMNTKSCTQEFSSHRKKYDEAIYCVKFHPNHPYLATGGADSTVKLYT